MAAGGGRRHEGEINIFSPSRLRNAARGPASAGYASKRTTSRSVLTNSRRGAGIDAGFDRIDWSSGTVRATKSLGVEITAAPDAGRSGTWIVCVSAASRPVSDSTNSWTFNGPGGASNVTSWRTGFRSAVPDPSGGRSGLDPLKTSRPSLPVATIETRVGVSLPPASAGSHTRATRGCPASPRSVPIQVRMALEETPDAEIDASAC